MVFPSLDDLIVRVGSRYKVVVEVAKRARQIVDGSIPLVSTKNDKEVAIASREIFEGKVYFEEFFE